MIEHGTPEWHRARWGRVTCSRFGDVMTQPRTKAAKEAGELGDTARTYMLELVAETAWLLHGTEPPDDLPERLGCLWGPPSVPQTVAMAWGSHFEGQALEVYEALTNRPVERPGLLVHPICPLIAGTPDGIVAVNNQARTIEVKCPTSREHVRTLASGQMPDDYAAQVQGEIWLARARDADFVSYDPRIDDLDLAMAIVRVERDEAFIGRLIDALSHFLDHYLRLLEALGLLTDDSAALRGAPLELGAQ